MTLYDLIVISSAFGGMIEVETTKRGEEAMKNSTILRNELPDLLIALVALLIALLIWGLVLAPVAV